jgi:hypothetical protein
MPSILIDGQADGAVLYAAPGKGMFIRVSGIDLTAASQGIVSLKSGTTEIWATQAMNNVTGVGGIVIPVDKERTLDCAPGQPLVLGNPSGVTLKGSLQVEVFGNPWI